MYCPARHGLEPKKSMDVFKLIREFKIIASLIKIWYVKSEVIRLGQETMIVSWLGQEVISDRRNFSAGKCKWMQASAIVTSPGFVGFLFPAISHIV